MKIIFTFVLSFFALSIVGQGPTKISVQSCTNLSANGIYTKGTPTSMSCDCYNKEGEMARIIFRANMQFVYESGSNCDNGKSKSSLSSINVIKDKADCNNILSGNTLNSCLVLDVSPVPSLSQWGIMILGLLMVVFGIVAVKKPRQILK